MRRSVLVRGLLAPGFALAAAIVCAAAGAALAHAQAPAPAAAQAVDPSTWVDDDARPVNKPKFYEQKLYAHEFRECIVEPMSRAFDIPDKLIWFAGVLGADTEHQAVNVNTFDEVPNSMWFTNRNHVRSVSPEAIRLGSRGEDLRPALPWTIKSAKRGGVNPGFNIQDAAGRRWVVKLDPPGHPQLGSGADAIATRLVWAAGFNVSHNVPVKFVPTDLTIDPELAAGEDGDPPFTPEDLNKLLERGHIGEGNAQYGQASLFVEGQPLGPIQARHRRSDDANDIYTHRDRRELRGLFVVMSWIGNWDTKDHQTYQAFIANADGKGATKSIQLDLGGSLGASAEGPKAPFKSYENSVDWGWITRRMLTLGFLEEPWRKFDQDTGIPSVGSFDAAHYEPDDFRPLQPHPAFSRRTLRDAYWGAKIVASFNDAQIEAAIDAAGYEDPRAKPALLAMLKERRDRVARHWFSRVAPLDFFRVEEGALWFRDLAVDRGLVPARGYEVKVVESNGGRTRELPTEFGGSALPLEGLGDATRVALELRVGRLDAEPVRVELVRKADGTWTITLVRHA